MTMQLPAQRPVSSSSQVRVRQHVNPLAAKYQEPIELEEGWNQRAYRDPQLPLHLDIGCARGRWCMDFAEQHQGQWNVLGVEIREVLVHSANKWRDNNDMHNLHFIFCNANVHLATILHRCAPGPRPSALAQVSIQFPDPHFKKKHHKRRVVQPALVATVAEHLELGGKVHLQSDIFEVMEEMRWSFRNHSSFQDLHQPDDWLQEESQTGIRTEREVATENKGEPVYRAVLQRV